MSVEERVSVNENVYESKNVGEQQLVADVGDGDDEQSPWSSWGGGGEWRAGTAATR